MYFGKHFYFTIKNLYILLILFWLSEKDPTQYISPAVWAIRPHDLHFFWMVLFADIFSLISNSCNIEKKFPTSQTQSLNTKSGDCKQTIFQTWPMTIFKKKYVNPKNKPIKTLRLLQINPKGQLFNNYGNYTETHCLFILASVILNWVQLISQKIRWAYFIFCFNIFALCKFCCGSNWEQKME